jgi:hypothetical protein
MSSNLIYKTCPKCNSIHHLQGKFCSRKCANSRSWSEADRQKKSTAALNFFADNPGPNKGKSNPRKGQDASGAFCHVSWCKVCQILIKARNKITCSKECSSLNHSLLLKKRLRKGRNFTKSGWYISPTAGRVYLESSWEFRVATDLDHHLIRWSRPRYLNYTLHGKKYMYYPDFYLVDYDFYLDPKNPFALSKDQEKLKAVIEENNIKLLVLNKNELSWNSIKELIGRSGGT